MTKESAVDTTDVFARLAAEDEARVREAEARRAAEHEAERQAYVKRRLDNLIPPLFRTAEVTDPRVRSWVDQRDGRSLLICGPTGTGKTFEAYGALRVIAEGLYLEKGLKTQRPMVEGWGPPPVKRHLAQAVAAPDLYARLRPRDGVDGEAVFDEYATTRWLMLDDLGTAKQSDWVEETTYRLINYRYVNQLPTIITTNVPPKELAAALGERVASRLAEMCEIVALKGPDRRRASE